jgi:hypothetical protein
VAIIANEALVTADLTPLKVVLDDQEPWSDFPIVVLTKGGGGPERNPAAARTATTSNKGWANQSSEQRLKSRAFTGFAGQLYKKVGLLPDSEPLQLVGVWNLRFAEKKYENSPR